MKLSLIDYIADQRLCEVETLDVYFWSSDRWYPHHTYALWNICHILKVKKLNFEADIPFTHAKDAFYEDLGSYCYGYTGLALPYLREINITHVTKCPLLWEDIFRHGRVMKLSWKVTCRGDDRDYFDKILLNLTIGINFHLRELYYLRPDILHPVPFNQSPGGTFNITEHGTKIDEYLKRNRVSWKKCKKAVIILRGLTERKGVRFLSLVGKDVSKMIARMVWDTRGTEVWTD